MVRVAAKMQSRGVDCQALWVITGGVPAGGEGLALTAQKGILVWYCPTTGAKGLTQFEVGGCGFYIQ